MHNTLSWILLTSPSAFNAIISASVVLLGISYGMPIAVNCCRGRRMLPERSFNLPESVGWALNIVRNLPYSFAEAITDSKFSDLAGVHCPDYYPLSLPP